MQAPMSKDKLHESIELVKSLLNKQKLVEGLVHSQQTPQHELVETIVHRQHLAELEKKLRGLHIADLAYILEVLPPSDRSRIWEIIRYERGGEVLLDISSTVRENLMEDMSHEEMIKVLSPLDGDDLSFIADDIPEPVLQQCLANMTHDDQAWLRSTLHYDEDKIGHLMTKEMVVSNEQLTIAEIAQQLRGLSELPSHNDKVFITDNRGILTGALTLQSLLLSLPDKKAKDVMATDIVKFSPDDDASEASKAFERYDLVSAPVINQRGKLIGRLTVDIVMDYIREESTDEVLSMAGLRGEEDIFAPLWDSARNRGVWLLINLCSAFIASRVIGAFEDTLIQLVALAALMPIVASVGGNSGNQTTALIIRGLSLGQITSHNTRHLFRKEIGISLVNGVSLGILVGLFALIMYHNVELSIVIAVAMLLTLVIAAILGLAVPILLDKTGKDPALGSSVIQTATTDSIGFLIFLSLASVFLVK